MSRWKRELEELNEWEVRKYVLSILEAAKKTMGHAPHGESEARRIIDMWETAVEAGHRRKKEAQERQVHLLFDLSNAGALKVALSDIGKRGKCEVLAFNELFSIGPLERLEVNEGQGRRQEWRSQRFSFAQNQLFNREHRIDRMAESLVNLAESRKITVWTADNAHDQIGLRFAIYLLRYRRAAIATVNVTQAYAAVGERFDNSLKPVSLGQLPFESLLELLRRSEDERPLAEESRRSYEREWLELSCRKDMLRIWQDGEIRGVPENYYDEDIIAAIEKLQETGEDAGFVSAGRVIATVIENQNQLIGDYFIEYRIWSLISDGRLEFRGLPAAMYLYKVRLKRN